MLSSQTVAMTNRWPTVYERRRWTARLAAACVLLGAGASVGALTAHLESAWTQEQIQALAASSSSQPALAPVESSRPVVVRKSRIVHVPSDPVIVYRYVPVPATGGGTASASGQPAGTAAEPPTSNPPTPPAPAGGVTAQPAPAQRPSLAPAPRPPSPAPQPAPPATTSSAS